MPRPICVKCEIELRCTKNSFLVRDPESGIAKPTYWSGDKFTCPSCSIEVVVGFGAPMDSEMGESMLSVDGKCLEFNYGRASK